MGRNTAPAVTLAALQALEGGADPVLVVTPADQTVTDAAAFTAALARAVRAAAEGAIVILGVTPDRPETGYGYIRAEGAARGAVRRKARPRHGRALPGRGGYFWNAGMFVLQGLGLDGGAGALPARHRRRLPRGLGRAQQTDASFVRPGKAEFAAVPGESVDYAVMEKCPGVLDIRMEPLDAGWNDLGAWEAVWQVADEGRRTATPAWATPSSATAATRWCTPPAGWSAWSGWTTWWWWRRPTPCWWPAARRART